MKPTGFRINRSDTSRVAPLAPCFSTQCPAMSIQPAIAADRWTMRRCFFVGYSFLILILYQVYFIFTCTRQIVHQICLQVLLWSYECKKSNTSLAINHIILVKCWLKMHLRRCNLQILQSGVISKALSQLTIMQNINGMVMTNINFFFQNRSKSKSGADPGIFIRGGGVQLPKNFDKQKKKKKKKEKRKWKKSF